MTDETDRPTSGSAGGRPGAEVKGPGPRLPNHRVGPLTEDRAVEAADPDLTPNTNRRITQELQDSVGSDHVEVPTNRPRLSRGEHASGRSFWPMVSGNRLVVTMGLCSVFLVAAIVALTAAGWWALAVAFLVLAFATLLVAETAIRLTHQTDRPSPSLAAAMTADGVANPDERYSEMVDEFQPAATVDDGPRHRAQPTDSDSEAVTVLYACLALSFSVVAILIPALDGGDWLWLIPVIAVPACVIVLGLRLLRSKGH